MGGRIVMSSFLYNYTQFQKAIPKELIFRVFRWASNIEWENMRETLLLWGNAVYSP